MGKRKPNLLARHRNLKALMLAIAVVLFWRGAWGLMDMYLLPDDHTMSFMISLVAGLVLLFFINHHKIDLS